MPASPRRQQPKVVAPVKPVAKPQQPVQKPQGFLAKPPAAKPAAPAKDRIMNQQQRQNYNQMVKSGDVAGAQALKGKIANNKGIAWQPKNTVQAQTPAVEAPAPVQDPYAGAENMPTYDPGMTPQFEGNLGTYNDMQGDLITGAQGELGGALSDMQKGIDWSSMTQVNTDPNAFQNSVDTVYKAFSDRNEPIFAKERENFEQEMANRGIPVGSQLYNEQKAQLDQRHNDARLQAQSQAEQMGMDYYEKQFNVQSQARKDQTAEALLNRNLNWEDFQKIASSIDLTDPRQAQAFENNKQLQAMLQQYQIDAQNSQNAWQSGENQMDRDTELRLQKLGYKQDLGKLQKQFDLTHTGRGPSSGGGGGGGGGGGTDPNAVGPDGLTEKQRQEMAMKQWEWQNNPYYQQFVKNNESAPWWSGILGTVGKGILGKTGDWLGDQIF